VSVVRWDEQDEEDDLARAVAAEWACLRRLTVRPGEPLHLDSDARETVVWALDRDAVLVRRPADVERSVRAEGALDVLVFAASAPAPDPFEPAGPVDVVRPSAVAGERVVDGLTSITRYEIGARAGAVGIGIDLVDIHPGRRSYPVLDIEEVAVVLRGSGRAIVAGAEREVQRGCVVGQGERFVAGPEGLRVLSFRERPRLP